MVFLVACGGDDDGAGKLADARPTMDAAIDGMPVTLTATFRGAARAGVHVYFLNADGTVVKTADTDADGVASAVMAAGGSVTAIDPVPGAVELAANDHLLVSYLGVKPGDHLALTGADDATLSFTLTTPPVEGAVGYDVITSCGAGALSPPQGEDPDASGELSLSRCRTGVDIAVVARGIEGKGQSVPLSGFYQADTMPVADQTLALEGPYAALVKRKLTFENAPEDLLLHVLHMPVTPRGLMQFDVPMSGSTGDVDVPDIAPLYTAVSMSFETGLNIHKVLDWGMPTADYKLDLANLLLPEFLEKPAYDFAAGKLAWSEATTGAVPDTTIVSIEAFRDATQQHWVWLALSPYSKNELKFPKLPTDVADWTPGEGDTVNVEGTSHLKVSGGGYDAIRTRPIDLTTGDFALIAGITGRIVSVIANRDFNPTLGRRTRQSLLGTPLIRRAIGHSPSVFSPRR